MARIMMSELLTPLSEDELMELEEAEKALPYFDEDSPEMTPAQLQQFSNKKEQHSTESPLLQAPYVGGTYRDYKGGKIMSTNTAEILNRGMECLVSNLGLIEAEIFISIVIREKFDYTKWQREYFDRIPANQLHEDVVTYAANHPYVGKAKEIIK